MHPCKQSHTHRQKEFSWRLCSKKGTGGNSRLTSVAPSFIGWHQVALKAFAFVYASTQCHMHHCVQSRREKKKKKKRGEKKKKEKKKGKKNEKRASRRRASKDILFSSSSSPPFFKAHWHGQTKQPGTHWWDYWRTKEFEGCAATAWTCRRRQSAHSSDAQTWQTAESQSWCPRCEWAWPWLQRTSGSACWRREQRTRWPDCAAAGAARSSSARRGRWCRPPRWLAGPAPSTQTAERADSFCDEHKC